MTKNMDGKLCDFNWNLKVVLESNRASEINTPTVELQLFTESDSHIMELNHTNLSNVIAKLKNALGTATDINK